MHGFEYVRCRAMTIQQFLRFACYYFVVIIACPIRSVRCFVPLQPTSSNLLLQGKNNQWKERFYFYTSSRPEQCYNCHDNYRPSRLVASSTSSSSSPAESFVGGKGEDLSQSATSKTKTTTTAAATSSKYQTIVAGNSSEKFTRNNVKIKYGLSNSNVTQAVRYESQQQRQQQQQQQSPTSTGHQKRIQIRDRVRAVKDRQGNSTDEEEVLKQDYYDQLLADCIAYDEWEYVLDVLDLMKQRGYKPNDNTYKVCLQACYNVSNAASAKEMLAAMDQAEGIVPDPSDIGLIVLTKCRKEQTDKGSGWWKKAYQLLKQYTEKFDNIPIAAYDSVLTCLADEKLWQDAVRLLRTLEQKQPQQQQQQPPPQQADAAIQKTLPTTSTYRIVIECCTRCDQIEQGVQILQSCIRNGLVPSVYTFELVITELSKKLQWRRAVQLLDIMEQELHIVPTVQIYNAVIAACSKAREVVQAKNLLYRMRKKAGSNRNIKPTIMAYNSVIAACASTSQWKDALHILDLAQREPGVTPDVYTYTNAIRACAKGGQTQKALAIFQVVKDKRLPLDSYFYTAAIEACSKSGLWQRALDLLKEMEDKGIKPSEVTFSVAITACGNGGQWQKALELLSTMRERNISTNLYVYNAAITAVSKAAKRKIKSSSSEDTGEESQLYKQVLSLLDQMQNDGIAPDGFTFSSAISCCGSEGRWQEALELIELMQQGGPRSQPNKVAYTAAISSCGRSGQADHAIKLFHQMKEQGLQVDRVAYNALFSALRVAKKSEAAYELWKDMLGTTNSKRAGIATMGSYPLATPDIITVTDAIAAMSSESDQEDSRNRVDKVFAEAVRRNIVLRNVNNHDPNRETDLSGMSFPVARAACRYVLNHVLSNSFAYKHDKHGSEVVFITGVGASHDDGSSSLRDYVQEILITDFSPPIESFVPEQEQSTVHLKGKALSSWISKQQR